MRQHTSWNVYRIDPMTGNYGEIVNSYHYSVIDKNNQDAAISYAKGEKMLNRYHYAVGNGLVTIFDTRKDS